MFNTKRIILAISLLSIVALTGALMAGPAFATKKESSHKTMICHYNDHTVLHAETLEITEMMGWYFRNVDDASVADHLANHYSDDDAMGDFVIDDTLAGSTTADCARLVEESGTWDPDYEAAEVEEEENEVEVD